MIEEEELDSQDHRILAVLRQDGRITNQQLAERVHLSASACSRRIARLEQAGVISGYAAIVDPQVLGQGTIVFVQITLSGQTEQDMKAFEEAVADCPAVLECHLMAGPADYLVKVAVRDLDDFSRVHRQYLACMPGVSHVQSNVTLRTVTQEASAHL